MVAVSPETIIQNGSAKFESEKQSDHKRTCCGGRSCHKVMRHRLQWCLVDPSGQIAVLMVAALLLIGLGTAVWSATGGTADFDDSWEQSMWMSWGLFFDPGTQTGVAADEPIHIKLVALIFSVFGFLYNLIMLGIIVEWIRAVMFEWSKSKNRVWCSKHVLILGWNEKVLYLLNEIWEDMANTNSRTRTVILAEGDAGEMLQEIKQHFRHMWADLSSWDRRWRMLGSLIVREGDQHSIDNLDRANASDAKDVIVLGRDGNPRDSDLNTVRNVVALASLPDPVKGRILAEVQVPEMSHVLMSLHPKAEVIHARTPTNQLLALLALQPVVGACIADLCSFSCGEELYVLSVPELVGLSFGDACRMFSKAVCIGLQSVHSLPEAHNTRVLLAPPDNRVVQEGDRVLLLASTYREATLDLDGQGLLQLSQHWRKMRQPIQSRQATKMVSSSPELFLSEQRHVIDVKKSIETESKPLLVVGWPADFGDMLAMLDGLVPHETTVKVLTEKTSSVVDASRKEFESKLKKLTVEHIEGARTSQKKLEELLTEEPAAILILAQKRGSYQNAEGLNIAEEEDVNDDAITSDSACLTTLLAIAEIRKKRQAPLLYTRTLVGLKECAGAAAAAAPEEKQVPVICELLDHRTELAVGRNSNLKEMALYFKSKAIETGLFTMAMSEPAVFNTLMVLMSPSCPSLHDVPAEDYLPQASTAEFDILGEYSYWEICSKVRQKDNSLLVGWLRETGGRELTPPDKEAVHTWSKADRLLILKQPEKLEREGSKSFPGDTPGATVQVVCST
eukprot:TRINITY_DN42327_c0_g1_i1.p1 TRINITY_DN42327_c0_g1~~TRINITY_DN42327_c0_g1_i1.p1  ORF type:complete len:791 (+),score=107.54 TRINITY_DN42327_c0_g1_i1:61-2433(+)